MKIRRLRYILENKNYRIKVDPKYLQVYFQDTSDIENEEYIDYTTITNIYLLGNVNDIYDFLVYQIDQLNPEDIVYLLNELDDYTDCVTPISKYKQVITVDLLHYIFVLNTEKERMEGKINNIIFDGDMVNIVDYVKLVMVNFYQKNYIVLKNMLKEKYKNYTSKKGKLLL